MNLNHKLKGVRCKIDLAKKKGGFNHSVEIVAVTKTHPFSIIQEAYEAGIKSIGENRVQESIQKFKTFEYMPNITKRFIGHLQSNKVKKCLELFDTIDSVHSLKLLRKISLHGQKIGKKTPVLLGVNIAGEKQKKGFLKTQVEEMLMCFDEKHIEIKGIMTVAPFTKDRDLIRDCFIQLRELKNMLNGFLSDDAMTELSMGMSGDYEIAVEEGATIVRLGTALFGSRG